MNPLNSILLEGNVVRDVQAKKTAKGTSVCKFAIASNRTYKSETGSFEKEVSFFDVEAWGKLSDICAENCSKGRGIRVVGRLKQDRWTDKDGKKNSHINVIAEHIEFRPVFQAPEDAVKAVEKEVAEQKAAITEENAPDNITAEEAVSF
ncbi:MAG: single-stranded DNA-binding protein [Treponema sp.]|nr:single-stranded DNA-binding protein [Candidatus Treponema caballi]